MKFDDIKTKLRRMDKKYYYGYQLLNSVDSNHNTPEIFIVSGNRSAGKTTYFTTDLLDVYNMDRENGKFIIFVRDKLELGNTVSGMFQTALDAYYDGWKIEEKVQDKIYSDIFLYEPYEVIEKDKETGEVVKNIKFKVHHCGWVIPLKNPKQIRQISATFNHAFWCYFDEFQGEKYIKDEVDKLMSIHTSIARGQGELVRFCPVIFSSNSFQLNNPYFEALGLNRKIQKNTKMYKGEGFVYQHTHNVLASEAQKNSAFNRAFSNSDYINHSANDEYLLDNNLCICNPDNWGRAMYYCTLIDGKNKYAVKLYNAVGLWYFDYKVDETCPIVYNITIDGAINYPLIKASMRFMKIKNAITSGCARFKDLKCKDMALSLFI